jgi:hypothetical protein
MQIFDLLSSKKFTASQFGIASLIAACMTLPEGTSKLTVLAGISVITAAGLIAQGLTDHGKEAAALGAQSDAH